MAARKTSPTKKKDLVTGHTNELAGFGKETIKVIDRENNETVCFIGLVDGVEKAFFPKPACLEQLEAVAELIQKKKLKKHLEQSKLEKAADFADRKYQKMLG